jgi:hypothetical protein
MELTLRLRRVAAFLYQERGLVLVWMVGRRTRSLESGFERFEHEGASGICGKGAQRPILQVTVESLSTPSEW